MLDGVRKGLDTERRFFEAHSAKTEETPSWLFRIKAATPVMDLRGIDAVALVRTIKEHATTRVPIQIKSSEGGRWHYQQEMPVLQAEYVRVIVVTPDMDAEAIRKATYELLQPVHDDNIRFGWFWQELVRTCPSRARRRALFSKIATQRSKAESE